jgi:hypothetical protein
VSEAFGDSSQSVPYPVVHKIFIMLVCFVLTVLHLKICTYDDAGAETISIFPFPFILYFHVIQYIKDVEKSVVNK